MTHEHDAPDPSLGPADERALPRKLRGIVGSVERIERAGELLMSFSPRQAARRLAQETGLGFDRAEDYVQGALLLMARNEQGVSVAERRAMLLEKARQTWRMAQERTRPVQVGNRETGFEVKSVADPDLRAMQAAVELEAKLYGVADPQSDQRAIALVLEVAKQVLATGPYAELVHGIARASGREVPPARSELPAGSGERV